MEKSLLKSAEIIAGALLEGLSGIVHGPFNKSGGPMGIEALTMVLGGNPQRGESIVDGINNVAGAICEVAESLNSVAEEIAAVKKNCFTIETKSAPKTVEDYFYDRLFSGFVAEELEYTPGPCVPEYELYELFCSYYLRNVPGPCKILTRRYFTDTMNKMGFRLTYPTNDPENGYFKNVWIKKKLIVSTECND